ncbi:MAG: nitroreductase family protein [Anaerolineales bacterium]
MPDANHLERDDLYAALIDRRSVRRYARRPLPETTLDEIRTLARDVDALVPENRFTLLVRDVVTGTDLVEALGAYGRVLSAPHFMVPFIMGEEHLLLDLGYRVQQIVVRMWERGIGSCYIGALGREITLRALFVLRREARIGSIVIFGPPASALGGRTINVVMRSTMGSTKRRPVKEIFFNRSFSKPASPPENLALLIEAARRAPSALNVQPWRFLWWKKQLYLFVQRENPKYGGEEKQGYRDFDAGVCMANLTLALEALGREGSWQLIEGAEADLPKYPETVEPIARLGLAGGGR